MRLGVCRVGGRIIDPGVLSSSGVGEESSALSGKRRPEGHLPGTVAGDPHPQPPVLGPANGIFRPTGSAAASVGSDDIADQVEAEPTVELGSD